MNKRRIVSAYFILVFMAYVLDLITTVIALSLGAVENNPTAYSIFNMSPVGTIFGMFLFISFWAVGMLCLVEIVYCVYKNLFEENLRVYSTLLLNGLIVIMYNSFKAIVNNLNVILNLIGG